jgi:hypothetical protein
MTMPEQQPPNYDALYDALTAMIPALRKLEAALAATTKQPLAVVDGEGRGSKKPKATLTSVSDA